MGMGTWVGLLAWLAEAGAWCRGRGWRGAIPMLNRIIILASRITTLP